MKCFTGLLTNIIWNCITENGHDIWNLECNESPQASQWQQVQEASVGRGSTGGQMAKEWHWPAEDYNCVYGKDHENHRLGTVFFVHTSSWEDIIHSFWMMYTVLRGRSMMSLFWMYTPQLKTKWWLKGQFLWGIRLDIRWNTYLLLRSSFMWSQCRIRERRFSNRQVKMSLQENGNGGK